MCCAGDAAASEGNPVAEVTNEAEYVCDWADFGPWSGGACGYVGDG